MARDESEPRHYRRGGSKKALAIIAIIIIAAIMTHKSEDSTQQPTEPTTKSPTNAPEGKHTQAEKNNLNNSNKKEHKYSNFVEKNAMLSEDIDEQLLVDAAGLIHENGWKCDTISSARFFIFGRGMSISCNKHRYNYEIEDRGGNWVVTLK